MLPFIGTPSTNLSVLSPHSPHPRCLLHWKWPAAAGLLITFGILFAAWSTSEPPLAARSPPPAHVFAAPPLSATFLSNNTPALGPESRALHRRRWLRALAVGLTRGFGPMTGHRRRLHSTVSGGMGDGSKVTDASAVQGQIWMLRAPTAVRGGLRGEAVEAERSGKEACAKVRGPVVVVGTDGSGTRAVARFLSLVNITLLVEPNVYHQLDVDGSRAGLHFTTIIRNLLEHTRSVAYRPNLTHMGQTGGGPAAFAAAEELTAKFADFLRQNACAALHKDPSHFVAWAFKKPDLMNLLPFLALQFPRMQVGVLDGPTLSSKPHTHLGPSHVRQRG